MTFTEKDEHAIHYTFYIKNNRKLKDKKYVLLMEENEGVIRLRAISRYKLKLRTLSQQDCFNSF